MPEWFWEVVKNLAAGGYDWRLTLFLYVFLFSGLIFLRMLREADSRRGLADWTRRRGWRGWYKSGVTWLLDLSDRWFLTEDQRENRAALTPGQWAWTGRLLDRAMLLAVLYPFLMLLVQWTVTGDPGRIGPLEVIPAESVKWKRITALAALCWYMMFTQYLISFFRRLEIWHSFPGSFARLKVPEVTIILATTSVMFAFSYTGYLSFFIIAISIYYLLKTMLCVPNGILILSIFYFLIYTWAYLSLAALAIISAGLIVLVGKNREVATARVPVFIFWTVGALTLTVHFLDTIHEDVRTMISLILALPMVNALFDFASIGVTRYALRKGAANVSWKTVLASAADIGAAAALFVLLGCAAIAYIHLLNEVAAAPLLPLGPAAGDPGLFAAIRADPHGYWWLYATFLSTLLPTALHLVIALFAVGPALMFNNWRVAVAGWMESCEKHFLKRLGSSAILALWLALAITLPAALIGQAYDWASVHHPTWGHRLLNFFEAFYLMLPGAGI